MWHACSCLFHFSYLLNHVPKVSGTIGKLKDSGIKTELWIECKGDVLSAHRTPFDSARTLPGQTAVARCCSQMCHEHTEHRAPASVVRPITETRFQHTTYSKWPPWSPHVIRYCSFVCFFESEREFNIIIKSCLTYHWDHRRFCFC